MKNKYVFIYAQSHIVNNACDPGTTSQSSTSVPEIRDEKPTD